MRGLFIVFEGVDGSGQDTQAELLEKNLEKMGYNVWLTREPTDGPFGQRAKQIMRGDAKKLGSLDLQNRMIMDRNHHEAEIKDHLAAGDAVICVRYLYSSLAYGQADGLSYDTLWKANERFIRPHLAIYLDLDPAKALRRVRRRAKKLGQPLELFEREDFLPKVRSNFRALLRNPDFLEFKQVAASGTREEVHQRIMEVVYPLLGLAGVE